MFAKHLGRPDYTNFAKSVSDKISFSRGINEITLTSNMNINLSYVAELIYCSNTGVENSSYILCVTCQLYPKYFKLFSYARGLNNCGHLKNESCMKFHPFIILQNGLVAYPTMKGNKEN